MSLGDRIRAAALAFAGPSADQVHEGLIGLFDIVEPCLTYFVRSDRAAHWHHLELRPGSTGPRACA